MSARWPLQRLLELVPPPPTSYEFDWELTERQLGRSLPSDYKALLEIYGPLEFAFFRLFQPDSPGGSSYLAWATQELRTDFESEEVPQPPPGVLELPPGVRFTFDDVIHWGQFDGPCLWYTGGSESPDEWPIVLFDPNSGEWFAYSGSLTELLLRWLTNDLRPPEIPWRWCRDFYLRLRDGTLFVTFRPPDRKGSRGSGLTVKVLEVVEVDRPSRRVTHYPRSLRLPVVAGSPAGEPGSDAAAGEEGPVVQRLRASGGLSSWLGRLVQLVPPPADRIGFDWSGVGQALGRALPADFMNLVDVYGDVLFANTFRLCHPTADPYYPDVTPPRSERSHFRSSIDVLTSTTEFHMRLEEPLIGWPPQLAPAQMDLRPANTIAWGGGDNGDFYIWHMIGDDPDEWPIVLFDSLLQTTFTFHGSVTELLVRWLTRELAPPQISSYWDQDLRMEGERPRCEFGPYYFDAQPSAVVYLDEGRLIYLDPPPDPPQPITRPPATGPAFRLNPDAFKAVPPELESPALRKAREAGGVSSTLERLISLVPPPVDREGYDWTGVENDLGTKLPTDYTQLVDIYGDTLFASTFQLHTPRNEQWPIAAMASSLRADLTCLAERGHRLLDALQLDPKQVIEWGGGNHNAWHTIGDNPDQWPLILISRGYDAWWTYHGTVTDLITRFLTFDLTPPELPDHWDGMPRRAGRLMPFCKFEPYNLKPWTWDEYMNDEIADESTTFTLPYIPIDPPNPT